jgi:hypothetical protein
MPLMRLCTLVRTFGFLLTASILSAIPAVAADEKKSALVIPLGYSRRPRWCS